MSPQRIGEVVKIIYFLAVEFDQHITRFETGLGSGRTVVNIGKANTLDLFAKIRDAAEIRSVA